MKMIPNRQEFLKRKKGTTMTCCDQSMSPLGYKVEQQYPSSKEQLEKNVKNGTTTFHRFVEHWYHPCPGGSKYIDVLKQDLILLTF